MAEIFVFFPSAFPAEVKPQVRILNEQPSNRLCTYFFLLIFGFIWIVDFARRPFEFWTQKIYSSEKWKSVKWKQCCWILSGINKPSCFGISILKPDCAVSYGSRLGRGLGKGYLFIPYCFLVSNWTALLLTNFEVHRPEDSIACGPGWRYNHRQRNRSP